jgi:hypothetical protein
VGAGLVDSVGARTEDALVAGELSAESEVVANKYRVNGAFAYLWAAMVVALTVFGVVLFVVALLDGNGPPFAFMFLWVAVLAWFWFVILAFISYEVVIFENNEIEFRSFVRKLRVSPEDLLTVYPMAGGLDPYTVSIRTRKGTARVIRMMTDFSGLVATLRELKPGLAVRGV